MNNKKHIIFLIILFVIVVLGVIILCNNRSNLQNKIGMISINNIKINKKATKKMKNLVMDADFLYEYNNVGFNVDDNGYINKIIFYTFESKNRSYGINDVKVKYKNQRLTAVEDFNRILGDGKEELSEIASSYKYIKYNEDNYELILTVLNEKIINISITKY